MSVSHFRGGWGQGQNGEKKSINKCDVISVCMKRTKLSLIQTLDSISKAECRWRWECRQQSLGLIQIKDSSREFTIMSVLLPFDFLHKIRIPHLRKGSLGVVWYLDVVFVVWVLEPSEVAHWFWLFTVLQGEWRQQFQLCERSEGHTLLKAIALFNSSV